MDMPKPTEQHKKYQAFVGTWAGDETLHPMPWEPEKVKVTSKTVNRLALDGFFLLIDHEQTRNGQICYRGHGVYGYEPQVQKYTMRWFDVMGFDPGPPALGTWEGKTLCFQHSHQRGHGRYTYNFERDGLYTLKIEMSQDGKDWIPFLEGTYKRS